MESNDVSTSDDRLAIVLSGAAARGAFQAGALSALMPALERAGERSPILLGTSAGAINAAYWGAHAHLPADTAAKELVGLWSEMSHADVYKSLPRAFGPWVLEYVAGVFGAGDGTESLLDTEPLRRTAEDRLKVDQLHANVAAGHVGKIGVVATRVPPGEGRREITMASGRSVLFLDECEPSNYHGDADRAQDVVRAPINHTHVLASAAIPVAFPAQPVTEPAEAAGWYVDGGVRLNAPLRHAIKLGANRIILISATSTEHGDAYDPPPDDPDPEPDMAYAGAQVLHAVLSDRMIEDIHAIHKMNALVEQVEGPDRSGPKLRRYRDRRKHYRRIELTTISPKPGQMGELATKVHRERTGFGRIGEVDNLLLGRVLRGAGNEKGYRELLSYLFFDEQYFVESIDAGRDAAEAALTARWGS